MTNKLILFFLMYLMLFCSCKSLKNINQNAITITKIKQHPYLIDHCKKLITTDNNGKKIDSIELYCDPGSGCNSYLFNNKNNFTLIDCNGNWYGINKKTGLIENLGWEWEKKLPNDIVGYYQYNYDKNEYELIISNEVSMELVYKFKDPKN